MRHTSLASPRAPASPARSLPDANLASAPAHQSMRVSTEIRDRMRGAVRDSRERPARFTQQGGSGSDLTCDIAAHETTGDSGAVELPRRVAGPAQITPRCSLHQPLPLAVYPEGIEKNPVAELVHALAAAGNDQRCRFESCQGSSRCR